MIELLVVLFSLSLLAATVRRVARNYNPKGDISYLTGKPVESGDLLLSEYQDSRKTHP